MPGPEIARIRAALAELSRLQPPVFGAEAHGFALNAPLAMTEVSAFEKEHRIVLPDDYREFISRAGNGGAGPFYGVFPLGQMDDNFGLRTWHESDGFVGVLASPFLLETEWNDTSEMPEDELTLRDEAEYDRRMEAFERSYWRSSLMNGAIPICHEGCALRVWLVVTGERAGQVWEDRRSECEGIKPLRTAVGGIATFGRWYDEWLEQCLTIAAAK